MSDQRKSVGRNLRKRTVRRMRNQLHLEVYSSAGCPKIKFDLSEKVPTDAALLAQAQALFLSMHTRNLDRCATKLGLPGCWRYFYAHLTHARKMQYEQDFRTLVVRAAMRFLGKPVRADRQSASS